MQTIQVVVDTQLLHDADAAARTGNINRSELIRRALREHLAALRNLELEARDRAGYLAMPPAEDECSEWEEVAAWPED